MVIKQTQRDLNDRWKEKIYTEYKQKLFSYFPFDYDSKRDSSRDDVSEFFKEDGTFWKFFKDELEPFVKRDDWTEKRWKGYGIKLSNAAKSAFQQATSLKNTLFQGEIMKVAFVLKHQISYIADTDLIRGKPPDNVTQTRLEIEGKIYEHQQGGEKPVEFTWPGEGTAGATIRNWVSYEIDQSTEMEPFEFPGEWGWFKLLKEADIRKRSSWEFTLEWTVPDHEELYRVIVPFQLKLIGRQDPLPLENLEGVFDFNCPEKLN